MPPQNKRRRRKGDLMGYFLWAADGKTKNKEYEFLECAFYTANLIFQWVSVLCLIPPGLIVIFQQFRFGIITLSMLWMATPIYLIILIKRTVKFARTKQLPRAKQGSVLRKSFFLMNQIFPSVLFFAAVFSLYTYNTERLENLSFFLYGLSGILLYFMVIMIVVTSEKSK